ncbi:MAG: TonB-dependent receptor [Flavobacteriaceae bacterium]|nr:TonB-dependent receptor [Flavobacteriaceae bacterium]
MKPILKNNIFKIYKKNKTILLGMVLFFFFSFNSFAQHILKGNITEYETEEVIPYVNVLVKTLGGKLINFTSTNEKGFYTIELPADFSKLIIETSIISHLSLSNEVILFNSEKHTYKLDFKLQQRLTELEEVFIEGKKKPIIVKKDTTVYNVNQFKDGSERVVEDLLKKLPGISINEKGIIKFKGKQVIRVLLDGDNLFNGNYIIGTKNIDSEIIEEVQAIEDYNTNHLLKGVKSSDDVAINLILKKGKTDISGNAEIGFGAENKTYFKTNLISVSKKLKGFSTISHNNIGENYTPYNFNSNSFDIAKLNEVAQRTNNLVNNNFNSNLPDNRTRVNNNYFGSINSLYKFSKKLSFRFNYNLFKDKLIRNEVTNTVYNFDNEQINVSTQNNFNKKPLINTLEYELIYNINKKSLLTSVGKLDSQNIENTSNGFNNESSFKNITESKDLFLKNNLEYTYRINNTNVFQFSTSLSTNSIPQSVNIITEVDNILQDINFKKNNFNAEASLFSKIKKNEISFSLGYDFKENFVDSDLQGILINNTPITNTIYYKLTKTYADINYQFKYGKWRFATEIKNELFNVNLNDNNINTRLNTSTFGIYPLLSINYFLNRESHFYTNYRLSNQLPNANNVYSGLILINNRALTNNEFNFNLFNNQSSTFGFRINDFYNLFQFNISTTYSFRKFDYINQLNVDEDISFFTSKVRITNNNRLDFRLDSEKYIHFLRSTINVNSSYSISEYQNIINDSGLRNNRSKSLFGQFHIRTGFKKPLNFENKISFRNNVFKSIDSNTTNSFTSFQNDFKAKYIKGNFKFILNSQYFNPDLGANISGDLFIDALLSYKPKKGKIEYLLKANNLLNNNLYKSINTSDFSTSIFEYNLQERFLLLSILFKY